MARINIDDSIHSDYRFIRLMTSLGGDYYKALGLMVGAWTMAQKFFKEKINEGLIPFEEWEAAPFEKILECKLAEKRDNGIYVKGSLSQFAWLAQKSEAGKSGGIKSGEKRRSKQNEAKRSGGEAEGCGDQANVKRKRSGVKRRPSGAKPLTPTLTQSLSPSLSVDLSINNKSGEILDFKNAQQKSIAEIQKNLKEKNITITPDQVIDLFNSTLAGTGQLNHCRGLGSPSLLNMLDTFDSFPTLKDWSHLFEQVKKAKSITGEEPGVFLATLDWLAVKENALKADAGKYNVLKSAAASNGNYDLTDDEINQLREAGEL